VIAVFSDTHGTDDHRLAGRAREAVDAADLVLHAGDFTTPTVLEAFERASARLVAVYGNVDGSAVRSRLEATETINVGDRRILLVHGHEHSETGLAMAGREAGVDLVISGHSHRPGVADAGDVTLLNPGSHADPRGSIPAHAELEPVDGRLEGSILDRAGATVDRFRV